MQGLYIVYQISKEPPKTDTKDKTTLVQTTSTSQEGKGSLAELFKPKGGEWSCPACAVKNGAAVTNCPCCNTAKPGTEGDKSTQVTWMLVVICSWITFCINCLFSWVFSVLYSIVCHWIKG